MRHSSPSLTYLAGPGSFIEARKIIPLLVETSSEHPSFHVVVLSLPGYAFSEAPKKKGFALTQYAEVGNKLMLSLGYNEYGEELSHSSLGCGLILLPSYAGRRLGTNCRPLWKFLTVTIMSSR